MMKEAILKFAEQFNYTPEVINSEKLRTHNKYVICGMGGSHLAADLLKLWDPSLDVVVHSDYGLPNVSDSDNTLFIFSSYSGNTEEILNGWTEAVQNGYLVSAIGVGGKLLDSAKENMLPYVQIPDTGIQPRSAMGFSLIGLTKLMGLTNKVEELNQLAYLLKPEEMETEGKGLAIQLVDKVPIVYCSNRNLPIAYNWKIKFNETGKIPAFYNVFPELNHNEMTGFDVVDSVKHLSDKFTFIFIKDNADNPVVIKRMEVTEKLYKDRGLAGISLELNGNDVLEKTFNSLILADWTAVYIAEHYGLESEKVPMVEEFKKKI